MTRGKQKIEAQKKNVEKNQKAKGSQLEARAVALKIVCPICKFVQVTQGRSSKVTPSRSELKYELILLDVQLANHNQLRDHYGSKHTKETPPPESS